MKAVIIAKRQKEKKSEQNVLKKKTMTIKRFNQQASFGIFGAAKMKSDRRKKKSRKWRGREEGRVGRRRGRRNMLWLAHEKLYSSCSHLSMKKHEK